MRHCNCAGFGCPYGWGFDSFARDCGQEFFQGRLLSGTLASPYRYRYRKHRKNRHYVPLEMVPIWIDYSNVRGCPSPLP